MCTLILAWRVFDDAPVVAAANRDEAIDRPSWPPGVLSEGPRVVAPQDEEAGGTWIGYNEHGVFVAITNRRTDLVGERSRGLLVRDALERESASDALAFVRGELADRGYAGFNLVIADERDATYLEWDGVLRETDLDPGVHVVVNAGLVNASLVDAGLADVDEKGAAIFSTASAVDAATPNAWLDGIQSVLVDHETGACVHADGFGTRSSSLVALYEDGTASYRFADGPPCRTDYREVSIPE